ncbi:MAG: ECF transporter S component [Candidatus Entotheonellia bacterium]
MSSSSPNPFPFPWQVRWSLRDVAALVAVCVVLGAILFLWEALLQLLSHVLGDVVAGLLYGGWLWGGLLLAFAIRKPGAALLGELGATLVPLALGTPQGFLVLVLGLVQGLGLEVVFAWARFQHWGLPVMLLAGAVAGLVGFAMTLVTPPLQLAGLPAGTILGVLGTTVLSGAVLGGWLCTFLGDRLLAIPAVRNFLGTPSA